MERAKEKKQKTTGGLGKEDPLDAWRKKKAEMDAKKSGDAIDDLEALAKGEGGWTAAPGSKKGAQRKKSGKGYTYRYPDGKGGWSSKKPGGKADQAHAAAIDKARTLTGKVSRQSRLAFEAERKGDYAASVRYLKRATMLARQQLSIAPKDSSTHRAVSQLIPDLENRTERARTMAAGEVADTMRDVTVSMMNATSKGIALEERGDYQEAAKAYAQAADHAETARKNPKATPADQSFYSRRYKENFEQSKEMTRKAAQDRAAKNKAAEAKPEAKGDSSLGGLSHSHTAYNAKKLKVKGMSEPVSFDQVKDPAAQAKFVRELFPQYSEEDHSRVGEKFRALAHTEDAKAKALIEEGQKKAYGKTLGIGQGPNISGGVDPKFGAEINDKIRAARRLGLFYTNASTAHDQQGNARRKAAIAQDASVAWNHKSRQERAAMRSMD